MLTPGNVSPEPLSRIIPDKVCLLTCAYNNVWLQKNTIKNLIILIGIKSMNV